MDLIANIAAIFSSSVYVIATIALVAILIVANWKVFEKFGEPGWKGIIPFYNSFIEFKYCWKTVYFWIMIAASFVGSIIQEVAKDGTVLDTFGGIISAVGTVLGLILLYKLSKSFGHGFGWLLGLVFLHPIFVLMLGFGKSEYIGNRD